jgi:glycosyltransferase involved in cell wall biosynthesis
MSLWIDVTTSATCRPPHVGISRLEANLAEQLCELHPEVRLCLFEAQERRWSEVPRDELVRIRGRQRTSPAPDPWPAVHVLRHDRGPAGGIEIFDRGDVLVTCGFAWRAEMGDMNRLYAMRQTIGLALVTMCHDLIPIHFTHLVPGMEQTFTPHLREMVRHADHVLCISRCTRRDLLRWINTIGERIPDTSVLPMGCEPWPRFEDALRADVREIVAQRFLLSVSTIERRKNHQTLVRAYARLVDWGVSDLPRLVFVGGIGEGGQALIDEIAADRRIRDRIVVLSGVADAELAALYQACLFTLYPSLYEGWGLPVSESLAARKLCLASDQAALREAGEEFADYLDPLDVEEWANRIHRYLSIPEALARREFDIRQYFRPRRWRESAAHVLAITSGLAQKSL